MTERTVGTLSNPDLPPTLDEMVERVEWWHREHAAWAVSHAGPDGTSFPPSWPLSYNETATLVLELVKQRDAAKESHVSAA